MEDKELFARLEGIVREKLEINEKRPITPEMNFKIDLGADSLDSYEIAYKVEDELKAHIPDENIPELENIKDYMNYLRKTEQI
jgi:acyl carrier protein